MEAQFLQPSNDFEAFQIPSTEDEVYFGKLRAAYKRATTAFTCFEDEDGWSVVIRDMFDAVIGRHRNSMLRVSEVVDHHTTSKTVDWIVSFNSGYPSIVKAKSLDGSFNESMVQLATWVSAGLEKTSQLQALTEELPHQPKRDILSVLGISIVGHIWYLVFAVKSKDGVEIKNWGDGVYWPWLRDTILKPPAQLPADGEPSD
ncbi:hypothetical protein MGYG_06072 [Nannizzia gypsea CBS 118893]|uniref:PD-(D/E)XK nuclease-like domain-containing protein n=1 Tax=Arthroderma gypseum (strain ATCC MYA-4604 / CBS 118893) TaxID=535722 RepID=E4V0D8_ARTGP|nr:hypothetical protein MGYG_06072 [Nannizzia gypsea CBS 118893]EFR03075.1 hypothetical protein MGYG_06072 [Nannizzia gypsea CBS 118893]